MTVMLPKIDTPVYTLVLPSNNKEIKYRPFLVKEEKMLLTAIEHGGANTPNPDTKFITNILKQVLSNCTFDKVDIDSLTSFDLEYLFINLIEKSKGHISPIEFRCEEIITDEDGEESTCGHITKINYDLRMIELKKDERHTKKIMITDKIGIIMRYPNFEMFSKMNFEGTNNNVELVNNTILDCIESIFEGENVISSKDVTREQLADWMETLSHANTQAITEFFETMPQLVGRVQFKCPACGKQHDITVKGLQDFLM